MGTLPHELKMTRHAQIRLAERNTRHDNIYNTKNLMRSSCKWYNKDDLIHDCALYRHCCYVTRKSAVMKYITDGDIEVLYNNRTKTAITVLPVKDKFKPITQYIKPEILKEQEKRKEDLKMRARRVQTCTDCGRVESVDMHGLCKRCAQRKTNMKARGKEYVRYLDLSDEEKLKVDNQIKAQARIKELREKEKELDKPAVLVAPDPTNYYTSKAEQAPVDTHIMKSPMPTKDSNNIEENNKDEQKKFIDTLKECGCEIPDDIMGNILNTLLATNKLKDIVMTIADDNNQKAILDLDQILNVAERKLQHNWEYNGFQEEDEKKFKSFLVWRRKLKSAIFFWRKVYQTNLLVELKKAWELYVSDPTEKPVLNSDKNRIESNLKRYQITTETISTIFNTKRPFTRIFYATTPEKAHEIFIKWLSDRQLHENKSKTTIVELKSEGEYGKETRRSEEND